MNERYIHSIAPTRVCDIGGWTDTWFSKYGEVFNIAIYPYVEVHMIVKSRKDEQIVINVSNYNERLSYDSKNIDLTDKHALLKAAFKLLEIPDEVSLDITINSLMPPGASTGTSAAVSTALVGALCKLTNKQLFPNEIAKMTHKIETQILNLQCGIQDQLSSAYGGINHIHISQYPNAVVQKLQVSDDVYRELERRMVLVYMGKSHVSSDVHKQVIDRLKTNPAVDVLNSLRECAIMASKSITNGDFDTLALAMNKNTDNQRLLHSSLVSEKAEVISSMARKHNSIGCKINGAGGNGGSVTILFGNDNRDKQNFLKELNKFVPEYMCHIPIYLSKTGLHVWES